MLTEACQQHLVIDLEKLPNRVITAYVRLKERGVTIEALSPPIDLALRRSTDDWFRRNVTSEEGLAVLRSLESAQ